MSPEAGSHHTESYRFSEIDSPVNTFLQRGYNDGRDIFNNLQLQEQVRQDKRNTVRRIGNIWNADQSPPELSPPDVDAASAYDVMETTLRGFVLTARWSDLAEEGVEPTRFYRNRRSHDLHKDWGKGDRLESPEQYVLAFHHARTVLGILQSKAVLSKRQFEILLEDTGLQGEEGTDMQAFLEELSSNIPLSQQPAENFISVSWTGDGSGESVYSNLSRIQRVLMTAVAEPARLKHGDVLRGAQFFGLGQKLFTHHALGGQDIALRAELADEIGEYLGAHAVLGE